MPRLPIDYSNTVIYKIVSNDLNITECYVGHTTDFVRRRACHKNACTNEKGKQYTMKVYKIIRENGGWNAYSMIEIEKYPCKDANEACSREREWFERLSSNLNTLCPQRSQEEYLHTAMLYSRQYRDDNRDEVLIRKKQFRLENLQEIDRLFICQCGKETNNHHKSRHLKTTFHTQYMLAMDSF